MTVTNFATYQIDQKNVVFTERLYAFDDGFVFCLRFFHDRFAVGDAEHRKVLLKGGRKQNPHRMSDESIFHFVPPFFLPNSFLNSFTSSYQRTETAAILEADKSCVAESGASFNSPATGV